MFELDGILIVGIPVALDLAHTAQSRPLAGDLHAADLVSSEEVFLGSHVRAITLRLAEKDEYTEQHTRRVALRAVQVGERARALVGAACARSRSAALVHDIGKLSVPDSILKKPGPLDDERVRDRQAPRRVGRQADRRSSAASRSPSAASCATTTSGSTARAIRPAHRRRASLSTRGSSTVCDVYDALISSRVYRPAWTTRRH